MVAHPFDAILVTGVEPSKTAFASYMKAYVPTVLTSIQAIRDTVLTGVETVMVDGLSYDYDATNTDADDGMTTIISSTGSRRYVKATSSATGGAGGGVTDTAKIDNASGGETSLAVTYSVAGSPAVATSTIIFLLNGIEQAASHYTATNGSSISFPALDAGDYLRIIILDPVSASGEVNTITEPGGSGIGWFIGKSSTDLQMKKAVQGTGILLTDAAQDITISVAADSLDETQLADKTAGDMMIYGASGVATVLSAGTAGQVLTMAGGLPSWAAVPEQPIDTINETHFAHKTEGDLLIYGASGVPTILGAGMNTYVLTMAGNVPTWAEIPTQPQDVNTIDETHFIHKTAGDIIIYAASGVPSRLGIGSTGQVLTVTGGIPAWEDSTGLAVDSVDETHFTHKTAGDLLIYGASGVPTILGIGSTDEVLTVSGGVATWSALPAQAVDTLDETHMIHKTAGDLMIYGASGVPTILGIGSESQVLTVTSGVPAWGAAGGVAVNTIDETHLIHKSAGDMLIYGASGVPTILSAGTNTHVLTLTAGVPTWAAAPGASGGIGNVSEDADPTLGGDLEGLDFDLIDMGVLYLNERATAEADRTNEGQLWVKSGAPNTLWYTNDASTDFQIATLDGTETFTGKTIDSDNNTITNIVNANIKAAAAIAVDKLAALTANEVVVTDGSGFLTNVTGVTDTEVGYLNGVTSAIQTQIDAKISDVTGDNLSALADVTITSIATDELLQWNGSAWINQTLSELGLATLTGTETLTNKTLTTPALTLAQSASPAPTAEGLIEWDTGDDEILIGDGVGTKVFSDDTKVALLAVANEFTATQNFNRTTLTDAAAIAWALDSNQVAQVTITADRAFSGAPTNIVDGAVYQLIIIQDGTGGWDITSWHADYGWGASPPTLTATAGAKDIFAFVGHGSALLPITVKLDA